VHRRQGGRDLFGTVFVVPLTLRDPLLVILDVLRADLAAFAWLHARDTDVPAPLAIEHRGADRGAAAVRAPRPVGVAGPEEVVGWPRQERAEPRNDPCIRIDRLEGRYEAITHQRTST
jgi:hypothetical protein